MAVIPLVFANEARPAAGAGAPVEQRGESDRARARSGGCMERTRPMSLALTLRLAGARAAQTRRLRHAPVPVDRRSRSSTRGRDIKRESGDRGPGSGLRPDFAGSSGEYGPVISITATSWR